MGSTIKKIIVIMFIALMLSSCNDSTPIESIRVPDPPGDHVPFQTISLSCIDLVFFGGNFTAVARTSHEYDSLYDKYVTSVLQHYWDIQYDTLLAQWRIISPELSDSEYDSLIRSYLYNYYPFKGTDTCQDFDIDFDNVTLLGMGTTAIGCFAPNYDITCVRNDAKKYIFFKVVVQEHGGCEGGTYKNIWALIPKVPSDYEVMFKREIIHDY